MFSEGQQIGSYTLIRKLGKGGFGEVWLAENPNIFSHEKVAIKLPLNDQIDLQAVKDEIFNWTLSGKHKNILPIIECETFGNQIAIVSEFAPDGSLQDLLNKRGSFLVAEAVEIIIGILDGLAHLHNRKIIHRDLKPDNVLFQGKIPRLTDFGISRAMQIDSQSKQRQELSYMSPEAFDGKRNVQTDIWSVGVILYQLLSGKLPFPQKTQIELVGALVMKEPAPLPDSVPPVLQYIVKKSLAKESSGRYQTADEMSGALRNVLSPPKIIESQTSSQAETLVLENPDKTAKLEIAYVQETIPIIEDNERETEPLNVQTEIKTPVRQQISEASEGILEDTDKTEQLVVEPTKDWQEIEADKQRQHEEEQAGLEKERLQREKEEQQRLESDFADGDSLEKWLKASSGKASSQAEAIKITLEILMGLEDLHEKGFIYLLREIETHKDEMITGDEIAVRTYKYMPPEVFEKNPSVSVQTDIWAVGAILQELLTGQLPFPQDEISSLIGAIFMYKPEPMPASVPEVLQEIVKKALQKKCENRFQTAREMIEALKNPNQFLAEKLAEEKRQREEVESKRYDQAIKDYTKEIELNPYRANTYFNRGNVYYIKGAYEQAFKDYDRAIELDEFTMQSFPAEYWARDFNKAIELNPDDADAYFHRGAVYDSLGDYNQAIADYGKALGINPNHKNAKNKIEKIIEKNEEIIENSEKELEEINKRLAELKAEEEQQRKLEETQKLKEAEEAKRQEEIKRRNQEEAERPEAKRKHYKQAITDCTKAIELKPYDADAYINRGIAYKNNGDYSLAIKDNNEAIKLKPNNAVAYINRGNAYEKKGNDLQAIADYRKALEIDQNNKDAKDNLEIALKKRERLEIEAKEKEAKEKKRNTRKKKNTAIGFSIGALAVITLGVMAWNGSLETSIIAPIALLIFSIVMIWFGTRD